jgi:xanthine dehydrogenase accessory factor
MEMDDWALLRAASEPSFSGALATVASAAGHAYRKAGAAMLLHADGRRTGCISPGCLEDDLQQRAERLAGRRTHELITYNLHPDEDPIWGSELGCGGVITVLLEPVEGGLRRSLRAAWSRVRAGEAVRLVRRMAGGTIRHAVVPLAAGAGDAAAEPDELPASVFLPRPRLILFGAGADAPPICDAAARIGFRVTVADWREPLLRPERFPLAESFAAGPGGVGLADALGIGGGDYVLLCSHHLRHDRGMLEAVLPRKPVYVGVLGSRKRAAALLDGLPADGRVRAPVGLPIGAVGPAEIAVSIAAELTAVRSVQRAMLGKEAADDANAGHLPGGGQRIAAGACETCG